MTKLTPLHVTVTLKIYIFFFFQFNMWSTRSQLILKPPRMVLAAVRYLASVDVSLTPVHHADDAQFDRYDPPTQYIHSIGPLVHQVQLGDHGQGPPTWTQAKATRNTHFELFTKSNENYTSLWYTVSLMGLIVQFTKLLHWRTKQTSDYLPSGSPTPGITTLRVTYPRSHYPQGHLAPGVTTLRVTSPLGSPTPGITTLRVT